MDVGNVTDIIKKSRHEGLHKTKKQQSVWLQADIYFVRAVRITGQEFLQKELETFSHYPSARIKISSIHQGCEMTVQRKNQPLL
jgi:hypothetical protein